MDRNNQPKKLPGFYIALCCCVIAIGAAGFFMQSDEDARSTTALTSVEETDPPYITVPQTYAPAVYSVTAEPVSETPVPETDAPADAAEAAAIPSEAVCEDYTYDNPDLEPASVIVRAEESGILSDPLPEMTVLCGFSDGELLYNDVLGDWRTHNGVDLAAEVGCSVSAAADGTVTKAGTGSFGSYVTIDHGDGLVTVYAQLSELSVSEGDTVSAGGVIGTVGESTGESVREPHLHFEVYKDGIPADPEEL